MNTPIQRTPQRRAFLTAGVALFAMAAAWNALAGVWFTGDFTQGGTVSSFDVTVHDLAHHGLVQAPTGAIPVTYSIGGMPAPKAWLIGAAALTAMAMFTRLGLFSIVAAVFAWLSRASAMAAEKTLMSEAAAGRFSRKGTDLATFVDLCWVTLALCAVLSIQLTYAAAVDRRRRERRGDEPHVGVLDAVQNVGETMLNRFNRPAAKPTVEEALADQNRLLGSWGTPTRSDKTTARRAQHTR